MCISVCVCVCVCGSACACECLCVWCCVGGKVYKATHSSGSFCVFLLIVKYLSALHSSAVAPLQLPLTLHIVSGDSYFAPNNIYNCPYIAPIANLYPLKCNFQRNQQITRLQPLNMHTNTQGCMILTSFTQTNMNAPSISLQHFDVFLLDLSLLCKA